VNADDLAVFRGARLLLLLSVASEVAAEETPDGLDVERLGIYDFLAAHPLLVAREPDDPDRLTLRLAGFDDRALAYGSAGQRLATGLTRLNRDLALLIKEGLVEMRADGRIRYRLTLQGHAAVERLNAGYAEAYRLAARFVIRRLRRLSGRRLRESLHQWTRDLP
jgi:hypothetical protein